MEARSESLAYAYVGTGFVIGVVSRVALLGSCFVGILGLFCVEVLHRVFDTAAVQSKGLQTGWQRR